jgi:hypothetical protein
MRSGREACGAEDGLKAFGWRHAERRRGGLTDKRTLAYYFTSITSPNLSSSLDLESSTVACVCARARASPSPFLSLSLSRARALSLSARACILVGGIVLLAHKRQEKQDMLVQVNHAD